ncbi:hypothetical protein NMD1_02267 [Novosphingobium sp. MD-1]|nr:hypothetical protein NMD1_02267 [Novosphingobium sp. MD-1]
MNMVDGEQDGQHEQRAGGEHSPASMPFDATEEAAESAAGARLALGDEQRLPWLEGADDVEFDDEEPGNGRFIGFAVLGLILLAAILGGVYWATHRGGPAANADGSLIEASREPYKIAPKEPGGKTFQGTGDSSFKVSEGEKPAANLAGGAVPAAAASASGSATAPAAAGANAPKPGAAPTAPAAGGVGVQIGAFSSSSSAEAAWSKLSGQHEALKGLNHRVVEGKADIGTVYRLQALAGDAGAANALCGRLQAGGLKCQVKR